MTEVTQILGAIETGEPQAADRLLPLVYDELRKLAAARLAHEKPGQTLDATALVHEAYLRLARPADREPLHWDGRGHFFAAAANRGASGRANASPTRIPHSENDLEKVRSTSTLS